MSSLGWAETRSLSFKEGSLGCHPVDGHSCVRKPLSSTAQAAGVRTNHPPCSSLPSVVPAGQWKHMYGTCIMSSRHGGVLYSLWETERPMDTNLPTGALQLYPRNFCP